MSHDWTDEIDYADYYDNYPDDLSPDADPDPDLAWLTGVSTSDLLETMQITLYIQMLERQFKE